MANVFISHRSNDKAESVKLANEIQNAGHQVWIDEWNINIGDSIVQRINEGLEGATYVMVCYSSFGINAPWMSREWMSTLARQLNGHGVKLLPVLLLGGQIPAILADIKYANLGTNWSVSVKELLDAIA